MPSNDSTLWCIRAGRTGEADSLFLQKKFIALGMSKMGDLSKFGTDPETLKKTIAERYPEKKAGAIPVVAGQLLRFVHEMQQGDFVLYPSKLDRRVYIGKVIGDYQYDPKMDINFPQLRTVEWLNSFPRTRFSQGALYEIGSGIAFFQVKNYSEEFFEALEGKTPQKVQEEDITVSIVAEDIEETTKDFILKQIAKELKGKPFESFVANLFQTMGYRTRVSPEGPDGGIDVVAYKDQLGLEPPIIKIQTKCSEDSVGDPVVSALYGKVETSEYGVLVTLGAYTKQAKHFARTKSNLRLIDGEELVEIILEHYEKLDSRYKGLLPLKRVYIPEQIEGTEE